MLLMPSDTALLGPLYDESSNVIARLIAEDFIRENANINTLIRDAKDLLAAVDMATSVSDIPGDLEYDQLRRSWALFGPGMYRRLEALEFVVRLNTAQQDQDRGQLYAMLGIIQTWLTIRRQTLELNGSEVLKQR